MNYKGMTTFHRPPNYILAGPFTFFLQLLGIQLQIHHRFFYLASLSKLIHSSLMTKGLVYQGPIQKKKKLKTKKTKLLLQSI